MEYPEITVEYLKNQFQEDITHDDVNDEQLEELVYLIDEAEREGEDAIDKALQYFSDMFNLHGVEAIQGYPIRPLDADYHLYNSDRSQTINLLYANAGDSFKNTLAYDTEVGQFLVTSWGDWVTTKEQESGGDWEEEAWEDWLKKDLNKYLPENIKDYFEYDADDDTTDKILWAAYQKAKEATGEMPSFDSGGLRMNIEKVGLAYAKFVKELLEEYGINISDDEDEDEDEDDLQQEEFNRQFSKSYSEYLNEQDQMNRDLINDEAFEERDSDEDSEEEFSGEIGDDEWNALLEKNKEEIRSWDWDQIKAECQSNAEENEDGDGYVGACYLGSVLSLAPSGKYYTSWTTNQTPKDEYEDSAFYDALEEVAEEQGGWTGSGEGSFTDMFFFMNIDEENEDRDEEDYVPNPNQEETQSEGKGRKGTVLKEEDEGQNKYSFKDVAGKLEERYKVEFYEERGRATIQVDDTFTDENVWYADNDPVRVDDEEKEFAHHTDEDGNAYDEGEVDQLIEGGFIKWGNPLTVLEYLYERNIIHDFDRYMILDEVGDSVPVIASSDDKNEAFEQYRTLRDENPDKKYYVFEFNEYITDEFEEWYQEESGDPEDDE